ncbi:universal stress protein [Mycolicibacterium moriokaense]|uniref:Universal stress protein n=1 Tax=Mycolicibacterium moriokaense TaxID=39691 RepID=A0AAD1HDH1_9MYCO|nr:universal stress protein [Mycolicibacterium moriokaense]MCV7040467.1 universal stress protein [Mycolicibacterium moriokaense]ORB15112.1 universal stress protein [Mycolicibacterium moriokaense]BBX03418.1 universal stress protein [Mycolicibacterium moriokaense]
MYNSRPPVVVGIDGSDTAIHAAQWAVAEAVSRSAPLRLLYVTKATHPSAEDYYDDIQRAEEALRNAQKAIEATGQPVEIQTATVSGVPGVSLVEEALDAEMLCVGSVGINRFARDVLGSTATYVATEAHCPVAIIRPQDDAHPESPDWIVVAATGDPGDESVIERAMEEAKLRRAPVLMLGGTTELDVIVEQWKGRYPDVHVYPVADGADIGRFLKTHDEWIQLVVVGAIDADELARILGPPGHSRFHRTAASVLIARKRKAD